MGIEEDNGFKVRNLANNNLSHASKDTYLICQRLDRIIALLERDDKTVIHSCPQCGAVGIPSKCDMGIGGPSTIVGVCGHRWIAELESNLI